MQLHEQDDVLSMWSPDEYKTPGTKALQDFGIAVALLASFSYVVYIMQPARPAAPKVGCESGGDAHARLSRVMD